MAHESSGGGYGDAFFVIGILVFLFIMWVASGGPARPIAQGGFFITAPQPISSGEAVRTGADLSYRAPFVLPPSLPRSPQANVRTSTERERQTEAEREEDNFERSAYRGDVTISRSTSGAKNTDPKKEYVRISLSSRAENPVTISSWRLTSAVTGDTASIPFGTELPLSGIIAAREPIVLNPGDDAYIVTGRSPIGASFRINMCMGYFTQYQTFSPSISRSCPLPKDELIAFSNIDLNREPYCEEFVEDIPRCSLVTSLPPTLSASCAAFVENNIHYNGCVENHRADRNFFDDEWRVYLGKNGELWKKERETIRLYDNQGKLVDQLSY